MKPCTIFPSLFALLWFGQMAAQDVHFTQFHRAALHSSPALAGADAAAWRYSAIWRQQWASVPVPYLSLQAGADGQLWQNGQARLDGGAAFLYDVAGDGRLGLSQLQLSLAPGWQRGAHGISIGFQAALAQRRVDAGLLSFANQFNGDVFDADLPSQEPLARSQFAFWDLGAGLAWRYRASARRYAQAGVALAHLNRPAQRFIEGEGIRMRLRWLYHAEWRAPLSAQWDGWLLGNVLRQGAYAEWQFGAGLSHHFGTKGLPLVLGWGLMYRWGDALAPMIELRRGPWSALLSYDLNISPFNVATNYRGGPELSIAYHAYRVPPPPASRACPVF